MIMEIVRLLVLNSSKGREGEIFSYLRIHWNKKKVA
jgi:hypothetical protein